jgi:hypothetical protein
MTIIETTDPHEPAHALPLGLEDVCAWLADRGAPGAAVQRAATGFQEVGRQLTVVQDRAGIRGVAILRRDGLWVVDAVDREAAFTCAASLDRRPRAVLTSAVCATWWKDAWGGLEAWSEARGATDADMGGLRAAIEQASAGLCPTEDLHLFLFDKTGTPGGP